MEDRRIGKHLILNITSPGPHANLVDCTFASGYTPRTNLNILQPALVSTEDDGR